MSNVTLKVNGKNHTVDIDPSTPLLYILRNDLELEGPRFGCGLGQCGACTVIIGGVATRSCITPTSSVKGEITTLEGLGRDGTLEGPNLTAIGDVLAASAMGLIASGGVAGLPDVETLLSLGHPRLEGVIVGKALYSRSLALEDALAAVASAAVGS